MEAYRPGKPISGTVAYPDSAATGQGGASSAGLRRGATQRLVAVGAELGELDVDGVGPASFRSRRVGGICVVIPAGRFQCGSFAPMVARRVVIPAIECDARHILTWWHG
jgi:hypothetical protein